MMKYLDFHAHFNSNDPKLLETFVDNCRKLDTGVCLSGGSYGEYDFTPNDEVIELCRKYSDYLIPIAKLELWKTADPAEVYHYAEKGVKGFKCIYPFYEYDHDLYMPVYEAAEKCGLPMLFHTGNYRPDPADREFRLPTLKNMNPITLDRIARSFPDLKIVMAHLGTRIFQDEAVKYIQMHPNLYADLGGCGQWNRLQPDEFAAMMSPGLPIIDVTMKNYRKLVLGSDAYITHPHIVTNGQLHYRLLLERIGVPQTIISEVMGKTAASWMGIELED